MSWKATAYVKGLRKAPDGSPITPSEKLILFILADYVNAETRVAWPSVSSIATAANLTLRRTRAILSSLRKKKLVNTIFRKAKHGGNQTNVYELTQFAVERAAENQPDIAGEDDESSRRGVTSASGKPPGEPSNEPQEEEESFSRRRKRQISLSDSAQIAKYSRAAFDLFVEKMNHKPTHNLYTERKQKMAERISEILIREHIVADPAELLRPWEYAINRMAESDWHMGRHPRTRGTRFDRFDDLAKDWDTFERWLNQ